MCVIQALIVLLLGVLIGPFAAHLAALFKKKGENVATQET